MMKAREAAYKALAAFHKYGAWSDVYLRGFLSNEGADTREASLATNITYGVIQNRLLLDYYISHYSSVRIERMDSAVIDILRLSVYQIVFLTKIPESAVVNEGVMLAKKYASRASGFVNAVLRKISASKNTLPDIKGKNVNDALSIKYSHPLWLVEYYVNRLGERETEKLLECVNGTVPTYAQVNTLKAKTEDVIRELENEGIKVSKHAFLDDCLEITSYGNLEKLPAFKDGRILIQDVAAKFAVMAAKPEKGYRVLDVCAAPGGKSFSAAVMMENEGHIVSCDIHENKLRHIKDGAQRLGVDIIDTIAMDGRKFEESFNESFDVVIVDAPCSGMGIIRKKPDIRYKNADKLKNLPDIQLNILRNTASYVKPGGTLLYSTCTVLERENEEVVKEFLSMDTRFETAKFILPGIGEAEGGYMTLWPHLHGTDGFFICRLRRKQ